MLDRPFLHAPGVSAASPGPGALLWLSSPGFTAQPQAEDPPAPGEGPSHSGARAVGAPFKQMLRDLSSSLSAPRVKEFGFGFILPESGKKEQVILAPLLGHKLLRPSPKPFACCQQSQGDREEGNCNSLGIAIVQFTTQPWGSLEKI